jgi:predicted dienelactone hydrolase
MKTVLTLAFACLSAAPAFAAAYTIISVREPGHGSVLYGAQRDFLSVEVFYPSPEKPTQVQMGEYLLNVSHIQQHPPPARGHHYLIVLSPGSISSADHHHDLATALGDAGFVVAVPLHTEDNPASASHAGSRVSLMDRTRNLHRIIDYMPSHWPGIDRHKVGAFGFGFGGVSVLALAGGVPDFGRMAEHCATSPDSVECKYIRDRHGDMADTIPLHPIWKRDPRIKAIVVAAPDMSLLFGPASLKGVTAPVQLWRAADDPWVPDIDNTAQLRRELSELAEEHVVAGAGHFSFEAPCHWDYALEHYRWCQDPPGFARAEFHKTFNAAVVDFFRQHLK